MAGNISDYLENALLDHVLKHTAYTSPTTVYAALYTAAPSDAGGGTEVSGGSYARTSITFGSASGGATDNTSAITFPTATGSWGTVTHVGIFDSATSGNLLWWGALTASKSVATGDVVQFAVGDLDIGLD